MLEGLLIHSANNFADSLATWDAGSIPAFVVKMNDTGGDLSSLIPPPRKRRRARAASRIRPINMRSLDLTSVASELRVNRPGYARSRCG